MDSSIPIILLASERSGTNLLRAIVGSHSSVASPPPCGVVDLLANRSYRYISSLVPPHLGELISDAILATQTHFNKWDVDLDSEAIRERMDTVSFWGLFHALNKIFAEEKGCLFWFSKEPDLFKHIYEIAMHMPNAKFVYMVRDGRDVATSMLKGGVHEHHIYNAAKRWADNQSFCLKALSDPLLRDRIFLLKYEELIESPAAVGIQLMKFIGLEFESEQMEFYKNKTVVEHSSKSEFWKNLAKPVDASNKGNYRNYLKKSDIQIFESVAWHEMRVLGYPLESKTKRKISTIEKTWFKLSAALRKKISKISNKDQIKQNNFRKSSVANIVDRSFDK